MYIGRRHGLGKHQGNTPKRPGKYPTAWLAVTLENSPAVVHYPAKVRRAFARAGSACQAFDDAFVT
jgi:hypothetical protein